VLFSIAGGDDVGMLEVQDAANVITEAIDPEAKVIFGAVTDESLKKGQIRVTVIATGFPEPTAKSAPANPFAQRIGSPSAKDKDLDVPPATVRTPREEHRRRVEQPIEKPKEEQARPPIVIRTHENPSRVEQKDIPVIEDSSVQPAPKPDGTNDEDTWGGLPSFLRRR
jgi:hypothetical protein